MIQLVGLHAWRADSAAAVIDVDQARRGFDQARRKVGQQLVHASALADLSDVDRSFLPAMAHDDGPSRMADIASRLGVDAAYAGQYRLRLIAAEVIEPRGHGLVAFTLPGLRDYLREHAACSHWGPDVELPPANRPALPGAEQERRQLPRAARQRRRPWIPPVALLNQRRATGPAAAGPHAASSRSPRARARRAPAAGRCHPAV